MENDGIKLVLAIQHAAVDSASGLDVTPEDMITALCSVTVGMTMDLAKEGVETKALLVMMKVVKSRLTTSLARRCVGITPKVAAPEAFAARATSPISPTSPAP